jgi:hypothetical protein
VDSTGTLNITGGHAVFGGRLMVGANGTGVVNQSGGTVEVNISDANPEEAAMIISDVLGSSGEYNLSGGELLVPNSAIHVGHWTGQNGTLNVTGGTIEAIGMRVAGRSHDVGGASGAVHQSGGDVFLGFLEMAANADPNASFGTYDLTGGNLSNGGNAVIGRDGIAFFTHTGGTHTINGNMVIAQTLTSSGGYHLGGTGFLDMTGGDISYGDGNPDPGFTFDGGTLHDAGNINFTLVNAGGTIEPGASPGTTNINGDYSVTSASAAYNAEIAGTGAGNYDVLNVTGMASLGGILNVSLIGGAPVLGDTDADNDVDLTDLNNVRNQFGGTGLGDTDGDNDVDLTDLNNVRNQFGEVGSGFVPAIGDSFDILTAAGGVSGTFATTNLPGLPAGRAWDVNYLANAVQLDVIAGGPAPVPEPSTLILAALGGIGALVVFGRRRRAR